MRLPLIAALGLAAGLLAGPAFAATTSSSHHHKAGMAMKSGTMHTASHHMMRETMRGHRHMMANSGASQDSDVDRLNNMSLQAARKGQNYNPGGMQGNMGGMQDGGMQGGGMQGGGMQGGGMQGHGMQGPGMQH